MVVVNFTALKCFKLCCKFKIELTQEEVEMSETRGLQEVDFRGGRIVLFFRLLKISFRVRQASESNFSHRS